jgi:hypothetical protein
MAREQHPEIRTSNDWATQNPEKATIYFTSGTLICQACKDFGASYDDMNEEGKNEVSGLVKNK